jgi:Lrp/AsnC family transcriptional regulator, leucine-responsive regulatory protein
MGAPNALVRPVIRPRVAMAEGTAKSYGVPDDVAGDAMHALDEIDRKILILLQNNDRLALAELSKAIGTAASTLNDRIKRLVSSGVIAGFHARLSPEALGLELLAFVFVGWSNPKVEPAFLKKIKASPAVLECHHVTGAWNYLIKVRVQTTRDLEQFLSEIVKSVAGVERTETMIVLSSAKETWALDASQQR